MSIAEIIITAVRVYVGSLSKEISYSSFKILGERVSSVSDEIFCIEQTLNAITLVN